MFYGLAPELGSIVTVPVQLHASCNAEGRRLQCPRQTFVPPEKRAGELGDRLSQIRQLTSSTSSRHRVSSACIRPTKD